MTGTTRSAHMCYVMLPLKDQAKDISGISDFICSSPKNISVATRRRVVTAAKCRET